MLPAVLLFLTNPPLYPHLADEINARTKVDQDIRFKFIDEMTAKKPTMATMNKLHEIDHDNTARMHWIVKEFGWPTPEMVGKDASYNAWLLVQHADDDKPFQKECLALIEPLARKGIVEGSNYAYLYDRVLVGENKLQRFGTQGKDQNGMMYIDPVENPAKVDAYRKQFGMPPLETYAAQLAEAYHEKLGPDWRARLTAPAKKKVS